MRLVHWLMFGAAVLAYGLMIAAAVFPRMR